MPSFTRYQLMAAGIIVAAALAGTCLLLVKNKPSTDGLKLTGITFSEPGAPTADSQQDLEQAGQQPPIIYAHVAGRVKKPGVYEFKPGARVIDAVRMAGGGLPGADLESVNLAQKLSDGDQIVIAAKGTVPPPEKSVVSTGRASGTSGTASTSARFNGASNHSKPSSAGPRVVNVNTANLQDLQELPGVGPAIAQRIVDYRTRQGSFKSVDDLDEVQGIGSVKLERMRPYVRF